MFSLCGAGTYLISWVVRVAKGCPIQRNKKGRKGSFLNFRFISTFPVYFKFLNSHRGRVGVNLCSDLYIKVFTV